MRTIFGIIKIKALRINISVFTFIAGAALFYADFSVYTALALAAAVIHECGHILCARAQRADIEAITIYPFGADIRIDNSKLSYRGETMIALSGPGANFITALVIYCLLFFCYTKAGMFFFFANMMLGIINLLPIKSLDGGKTLEFLLCDHMPLDSAMKILDVVSMVFFILLTFFALFVLAATGYNFSLLVICAYLFITIYINEKT